MKWFHSLSALVASAAVMASASPVLPRADPLRIYRLKVVAPTASNLNGRYLSIRDGSVGVFTAGNVDAGPRLSSAAEVDAQEQPPAPARFYVTSSATSGADAHHYELHTYPVGIVDHALALNGTASLLFLSDVANPGTLRSNGPNGNRVDWTSFTLGGYDEGGSGDNAAVVKRLPPPLLSNGLSYAGSRGRWVLIQRASNAFAAAWYDGVSPILDNYRPVNIAYEEESNSSGSSGV